MKQFSAEKYIHLFDTPVDGINGADNVLRPGNVGRYRCKTVKHGERLDVEIFPIWNTASEAKEARKAAKTKKAQTAVNDRNAKKKIERIINENFDRCDIRLDLTYENEYLPIREVAERDMNNYIRRVRAYRRKNGLPELKYAYSIEYADEDGVKKRGHHHIIMSGMDRDEAERLWGKGRANSDRMQPDPDGGFAGAALYLIKCGPRSKGKRRWSCSKNLKKPRVTTADNKISRRRANELAADVDQYPKELFEKLYPGYVFTEVEIKSSEYVAGVYIYAHMRLRR